MTGTVPDTRYARSSGLHIAYQVFGEGPVDIALLPGFISHIDYAWHELMLNRFMRKLAGFARVIAFDKRGMGLSDREDNDAAPDLEQRSQDILAVLDAAGSTKAGLLAWSEGGPTALHFSHEHPDRVAALILIGTTARFSVDSDYPEGIPVEILEIFIDTLREEWGTGVGFELHAPSLADDARARAWWAAYQRLAATPGAVDSSLRMQLDVDVRKLLPEVAVPTLVVHQTQDMVVPVECGRHLAAHIDGATLLERDGEDHLYWLGDQNLTIEAIRQLMSKTPDGAPLRRMRRTQRSARTGWASITEAEADVVHLVAEGLSNREIGARLAISPRTVQTHITHVLAKLDLPGRAALAAQAVHNLSPP